MQSIKKFLDPDRAWKNASPDLEQSLLAGDKRRERGGRG